MLYLTKLTIQRQYQPIFSKRFMCSVILTKRNR